MVYAQKKLGLVSGYSRIRSTFVCYVQSARWSQGSDSEGQRPGCSIVHVQWVTRHPLKGPRLWWITVLEVHGHRQTKYKPQQSASVSLRQCPRHTQETAVQFSWFWTQWGYGACDSHIILASQQVSLMWPGAEAISQCCEEQQAAGMGFSMAARLSVAAFDVTKRAGRAGRRGREGISVLDGFRGSALVQLRLARSCLFHTKRRLTQLMSKNIECGARFKVLIRAGLLFESLCEFSLNHSVSVLAQRLQEQALTAVAGEQIYWS